MIVWIPVLVMCVGLIMYFIAANPKVQELGRIAFFVGLLVTVLRSGPEMLRIVG